MRWRCRAAQELTFREDAFHIHAGFAYLSAGALFLRQHAADFLVAATAPGRAPHAGLQLAAADVFFSLGLNSPPAELANRMAHYRTPLGEARIVERKAHERRHLQRDAHMVALKLLLESALHSAPTNVAAAAAAAGHDGEDDFVIRAAAGEGGRGPETGDHGRAREWRADDVATCAGDGCLLITNVPAVDRPEHLSAAQARGPPPAPYQLRPRPGVA